MYEQVKAVIALFVCMSSLAIANVYAGYDEDVAAINKDMPKQVKQLNNRQIECNHWGGEEPYDAERAAQINAAVIKLRCSTLERDEKKLLKKYNSKPSIIESINKAKTFY